LKSQHQPHRSNKEQTALNPIENNPKATATMVAAPTSSSATTITVLGATGLQGGSVIKHLLSSPKPYRIRAITRDPSKEAGKKLQEQGVEVVKAELNDKESIKKALDGQDLVFVSLGC
jgi:hypothetical protein